MRGENDGFWYKDAVIYELHVRAFADSNGDGIGDFAGLTGKLDYLKDLGITALWLLPFYPSPLHDGGYDIADYKGIHPEYGTLEDFLKFLEEAHRRNIKVITELVLNHTSIDHAWFQRARRAPPGSTERDFYVWSDTPKSYSSARIIFRDFETSNWSWDPVAHAYYWHRFFFHQPDLNFDNPAVHEAMFDVIDHWMSLGVDGVRLDAVPYLYEREGTSCENLEETHRFLKKLRAYVDKKYNGRMLLAEANQWPADAAAYFGDGDECHMNFHFPLMPRLFMALTLEDTFPIIDILEQTPPIPENCQWATFLRNHDELTLEMVTEEERDYMYRVYAREHRARINLGIRRRLAPLLGDRRRMELLNSILFSLPGTPVIYYGDEIGMGDNFYLGDRDGVRTPMQWNADRNAGFSRANPQRLYLPLVVDPNYHYEAINVEAQQGNPSSLLWWTKHLIALHKRTRTFGRGRIEFIESNNAKVLTLLREYEGERILFVANLSRFPQYASLELAHHKGSEPIELSGRSRFPRIQEVPWGLSLGPYGYFWFELTSPEQTVMELSSTLIASDVWWDISASSQLAEHLAHHAITQRWFRSKGRQALQKTIRDRILLEEGEERFLLVLLQIDYSAALSETYVLPLGFLRDSVQREQSGLHPSCFLGTLQISNTKESGQLFDATSSRAFQQLLLKKLQGSLRIHGVTGDLVFVSTPLLEQSLSENSLVPRYQELDQTNSVIFYGNQLVLKLLRVIEEGVNSEVEMLNFLAKKPQRLAPRAMGHFEWHPPTGETAVFGILTEFVNNQGTAWTLFSDTLRSFFERVLTQDLSCPPAVPPSLTQQTPLPDDWSALVEPLPSLVALLAHRTAELHLALASDAITPAFAPEPFDILYQQSLYQSARGLLGRTAEQLRHHQEGLAAPIQAQIKGFLESLPRLNNRIRDVLVGRFEALRIRCHGDLHLGQILFTGSDFVLIDFEGEPARSLRERRYKRCPLRDIAGLLRSFEYAAEAGLRQSHIRPEDAERLTPWAQSWAEWLTIIFTSTYLEHVQQAHFVPPPGQDFQRLLRFYMIEKCIYEIGYELNNRPDWLPIPLIGIARLLEQPEP